MNLSVLYNKIPDKYKKFAYGAVTTYVATHYGPAAGKVSGKLLVVLGTYLSG